MKFVIVGLAAIMLIAAGVSSSPAFSHSDGTNSDRCHHDWANGSDEYHCH